MECEGVKPVLAQHCMKFHFPVKWEAAEEWAESEGQILLGLSDNLRLVRTGQGQDQPFAGHRSQEKVLEVVEHIRDTGRLEAGLLRFSWDF